MTDRSSRKLPPHVYIYTSHPDNPKVAALNDAEYKAWHLTLRSARSQVPAGQWASREYLERALGEYAVHIDVLMRRDLLRRLGPIYFSANWDINQPGITSDTHRALQNAWRDAEAHRKEGNRTRQQRKRHAHVTPMSRPAERGADRPTLRVSTLLDASLLDASLRSSVSAEDERSGPIAAGAASSPTLPDMSGLWTPTRCVRCHAVITDRDDAYEGDGPDAVVHLNHCPDMEDLPF